MAPTKPRSGAVLMNDGIGSGPAGRRHRTGDAFLEAAASERPGYRVAEENADPDAGAYPLTEDAHDFHVLGQEETAVDEDADLPLCGREESVPGLTGTATRCG
jgi:hypothetical protein